MGSEIDVLCLIGNKLPDINEVLSCILEYSPTFNSKKQNGAVSAALDATFNL